MEAVDSYKSAALQSMRATVDALESEVAKARGYLKRARGSRPSTTAASRGSAPASWPAGRPGGMTNPAASNSGFSALVGVAAAFADTDDALRTKDIDERDFTVEGAGPSAPGLAAIRDYAGGLRLHGGTAIFSAMRRAYQRAVIHAEADKGSSPRSC